MKKYIFSLLLLFFAITTFTQTRNFRLVKSATENPTNQKRKAVVIGMSDYGEGRSLNNTLNDANDMAKVLTQLGFEVTLLKNNDLRNLKTNLNDWYNGIEGNDMAIFYFAGHGMEVNGENYLIPVDAELNTQTDVEYNALNVNQVLGNMDEKKVGMKLLILDACRNNPFKRSWSRGSESNGLAQMAAPKGTYIAFAASPGFTAQDGDNYSLKNGVFTHYLKQEILKSGVTIDQIFNNVTGDVTTLTHDQQTPFKNSSLSKDFYFLPSANNNNLSIETKKNPSAETFKKYYYYIDQNNNKSTQQFDSEEETETYMKTNTIYGKVYSNTGEIFVVEAPEVTKPAEETLTKYYYYVDQKNKKSTQQFTTQDEAETYMRTNSLYGKIYSNTGEVFVVDALVVEDNNKSDTAVDDKKINTDNKSVPDKLTEANNLYNRNAYNRAYAIYSSLNEDELDPKSMKNLGYMYHVGKGVSQDYAKAKYWYQKAADAGNARAISNLASLYEDGKGVEKDYVQAKNLYERAADLGDVIAMGRLAIMFQLGHGVPKNIDQSKYWLQRAANAGAGAGFSIFKSSIK